MNITGVNASAQQSTLVSRSHEADVNVKSKPSQTEKARRREEDFTVLVQLRAAWPGWLQVDSDRAARVTEIWPARWRLMKLYKADTRAWHSMRAGLYILPVWTMSFAWQMKVYIFSTRSICDPGTA